MDDEEELRDLVDVLRQPLQGRPVLVPLGTQAFLEGTLDPRGYYRTPSSDSEPSGETFDVGICGSSGERNSSSSSDGDGDGDEEYVIIRTQNRDEDGEDEESERTVTRQQAKEFFEAERDAHLRATKQRRQGGGGVETKKGGEASEQSAKEISATRKVASGKPTSPATSKSSTPATDSAKASGGGGLDADEPQQAFFEIREELDEQGREVRAEAVDVSRQLAMLESDAPGGVVDERTTRQPHRGSSPGDTVAHGETVRTKGNATTINGATSAATDNTSKKVISDAEYARLSARLEELALLEEHAEHSKATNTASRKGLQGGGWSSGFLNNKKKKTSKPNKPPLHNLPPPSGESQSTAHEQTAATSSASEPRSRAVSFDPKRNDVREIPRIGQRSALELRKPPPSPQAMSWSGESSAGGSGVWTAASGVVRERAKPSSKKKPAIPLRTGGVAAAASESASTSQPDQQQQPKRLSRFAQERLRQQQEQAGR
jgi:hypothetical protein